MGRTVNAKTFNSEVICALATLNKMAMAHIKNHKLRTRILRNLWLKSQRRIKEEKDCL